MLDEHFTKSLRMLYAGADDRKEGNNLRRYKWFKKMGHEVRYHSLALPFSRRFDPRRFLQQRFLRGPSWAGINRTFVKACREYSPDVVWVDKGYALFPESLAEIRKQPGVILVSFVNDTPFTLRPKERHLWRHFKAGIPLYDVHLVSQGFQVRQFLEAGARRVFRYLHGLDPDVHRPQPSSLAAPGAEGGLVFIGNCEPDRVALAEELFRAFGARFKIYGPHWDRLGSSFLRHSGCLNAPVFGERYAATIGAARVCLGLLSASNQDRITRRSFEIPGCGGCFLGQRTPDHMRLLREGKEAIFWSDTQELIEGAERLLEDDRMVRNLKAAALHRSEELGFGYDRCIPRWLGFIFGDRRIGDELAEVSAEEECMPDGSLPIPSV